MAVGMGMEMALELEWELELELLSCAVSLRFFRQQETYDCCKIAAEPKRAAQRQFAMRLSLLRLRKCSKCSAVAVAVAAAAAAVVILFANFAAVKSEHKSTKQHNKKSNKK